MGEVEVRMGEIEVRRMTLEVRRGEVEVRRGGYEGEIVSGVPGRDRDRGGVGGGHVRVILQRVVLRNSDKRWEVTVGMQALERRLLGQPALGSGPHNFSREVS